jgi:hypothetical protein
MAAGFGCAGALRHQAPRSSWGAFSGINIPFHYTSLKLTALLASFPEIWHVRVRDFCWWVTGWLAVSPGCTRAAALSWDFRMTYHFPCRSANFHRRSPPPGARFRHPKWMFHGVLLRSGWMGCNIHSDMHAPQGCLALRMAQSDMLPT